MVGDGADGRLRSEPSRPDSRPDSRPEPEATGSNTISRPESHVGGADDISGSVADVSGGVAEVSAGVAVPPELPSTGLAGTGGFKNGCR